uniref:PR domain zinc finger protein 2 n=1 Tax=Oncorhynchus kisutch TaxID=8019 RepID=A0A8C7HPU0_ONCKI
CRSQQKFAVSEDSKEKSTQLPKAMEDSHTLYISELGDDDNLEEEMEDKELEETHCSLYLMSMEMDELADSNTSCQKPEAKGSDLKQDLGSVSHSSTPELPEDPDHDPDVELQDSFPCQFCERNFTSKQGLERHIHIHTLANHHTHIFMCKYCSKSFGSKIGRRRHERRHENAKARPGSLIKPVEPPSSALQRNGPECVSSPSSSSASVLADREQASTSDEHGELQGGHTCKYCKKVFSTHTNMRRHQRRIHERHLRLKGKEAPLLQEAKHPKLPPIKSQQDTNNTSQVAVLEIESDQEEQYMLDISGNISENLSFYIDGKIVSTSTVSGCEVVEVNSGSATLVGLNAVIINPAQISQALKVETATHTGKGIPGQPLTKRRTATPPLLPQIKTELESEVLSSSSSSIVSSLIESLIPQNTESTILQRERTVYLSPKLKQLLQMQDGLKPSFALITEGQKLCSPLSLTVLPAGLGRFKRRTGSPPNSPQQSPMSNVESTTTDVGVSIAVNAPTLSSNDEKGWSPMSGGCSCNQQPLDLSNAVKKSEDEALREAVLDLSVHRKSADSEAKRILVPQPLNKKRKPNTSMLEKVLMNEYANLEVAAEQELSILENHDAPLVTDFAIVTASDMSPATEGEVFGLTFPSAALSPSPSSLASVPRQSISPCTIALASPSPHPILPTAPSLITVLAPPTSSSSNSTNQPILQVLASKISPNPLIICTEDSLNSAESPAQIVINQQQPLSLPYETVDPSILVSSFEQSVTLSTLSAVISECPTRQESISSPVPAIIKTESNQKVVSEDISICPSKTPPPSEGTSQVEESSNETLSKLQETFTKEFICNVCDKLFHSMKELGHHVSEHSDEWPYKCEFCVLLFGKPTALLDHRSTLHGVGKSYVCCACTKEFAYLCNLKHHQKELHPGRECKYTEEENGKLRPQNYNNATKGSTEALSYCAMAESNKPVIKDEGELDDATEELFTTIKIMASEGGKPKGLDVCLGINQHYPSFKPPPFPYHNRTPVGSVASATNFTTHNIPQTFSTAIRCTKCGKSFDNMPELHKHILACANASDKRRYTPNKNPIPLRHFAKAQNGVLSSTNSTNGQNALHTASQTNRPKLNQEPPAKLKLNALNKRKKQLVQRAISQRSKPTSLTKKTSSLGDEEQEIYVCPHCIREFTYRRSRTKHMAVCPRKPAAKEAKKRKDGSISYTKENNGHLRREVLHLEEKSDHEQKSRAHSSSPTKRTAILPAHKVLSNKKSKAIIAMASVQTPQEAPKLTALSLVHPFNSPQRQGSRMQHGVKEIRSNITMVKSHQQPPQVDEHPCSQSGRVRGPVTRSLQQIVVTDSAKEEQLTSQEPPGDLQVFFA